MAHFHEKAETVYKNGITNGTKMELPMVQEWNYQWHNIGLSNGTRMELPMV